MQNRQYKEVMLSHIPVPDSIVKQYDNMVFKLALGYAYGKHLESHLDDIYQEGLRGLMYAYRTCKPGYTLSTHIYNWARAYMSNYIIRVASIVRLKQSSQMEKDYWQGNFNPDYSLSVNVQGFKGITYCDRIPDYTTPEALCSLEELRNMVKDKVPKVRKRLNKKEKLIFDNRLYVDGDPYMTLKELGEVIGKSARYAYYLECKLKEKLNRSFKRAGIVLNPEVRQKKKESINGRSRL